MIPLLLRPTVLSFRNRFRRHRRDTGVRLRDWIILLFGLSLMVGIYLGTARALWFAEQRRALAYIPPDVPLGMFFLFLFGMLLFSCMVTAFGSLFLSRDLDLVLSAPLRRGDLFWGKLAEIIYSSSWMAVFFGLPAVLAFGRAYHVGPLFYLHALVAVIPYFVIPAAFAMIAVTLFTRIVPLSRTRELLFLALGAFLFLVYQAIQLLSPDENMGGDINSILRIVGSLSAPQRDWLPSYWIAQTLGQSLEAKGPVRWVFLIMSYTTATALVGLAYLTLDRLYPDAFSLSRSLTHRGPRSVGGFSRVLHSIVRPLDAPIRALVLKEYRMFSRDITQTIQLLLLIGICVIYLYNFSLVRSLDTFPADVQQWWRAFLLVMNLCMGAFVITAACTRFVFPSVSLEGPSYWILQTSPLSITQLLRTKLWTWYLPLAIVSAVVFSTGAWALRSESAVILVTIFSSAVVCYGIVGLAVGCGSIFANFEWEHASQLAASLGSLVFMFLSTFLIAFNILPTVALIFVRDSILTHPSGALEWALWAIAQLALLSYLNIRVAGGALALGERSLRRRME